MNKSKFMKIFSLLLALAMLTGTIFVGCGSKEPATQTPEAEEKTNNISKSEEKPVTLKFTIFSQEQQAAYTKMDISGTYKKIKPNVTIEIEKVKDSGDFEQMLKIRKTANELPDIMPLKPYMLANYQDVLAPLNDIEAAQKNMFAQSFAIDGNILGVPGSSFNEFVWYRKSIFKEYNLSIPKTWDEFVAAAITIKEGGKYIPILMGGKDAWPTYPFNEFMPSLEANDGKLWNTMATQDEPFTKDQPFYKAYAKIQQLYDAGVMGPDPLGVGFDQVKVMFGPKKGAMICAGQWFSKDIQRQLDGDFSDVGTFLLPVRDNADDKLNTIAMVDSFFATPKDGKNLEEAKDFINFLFSEDWYLPYMNERGLTSTVKGLKTEIPPVLAEAFENIDVNYVLYDGGNADYKKIESAVKFNVKKLGQQMMTGNELDKMMEELNRKWKDARAALK